MKNDIRRSNKEAAMRRWGQTVAMCVWAGFAPVAVQISQAGQLPEDVHPVSRSRLPPIDREELDTERREAYDSAMRAAGSEGAPMGAAALRLHGSGTDLRFSGPLGRRLTELAILTTAREHDQPYEWALHELDALAVGLDEVLIDVVRHRKPITGVGDPEAIIMEVGRELFMTRRLGSDTYARALARLGKTNLVDLIDLMGRYASTAATLTAVLRIDPEDMIRLETATGNPRWFENAGVTRGRIPPESTGTRTIKESVL